MTHIPSAKLRTSHSCEFRCFLTPGGPDLRSPLRITPALSRHSRLPRRSSAQPIEMRVHHGTRLPSVLSSFWYTADLRHSFIKELQGIGHLYWAETADRSFRVTNDVPVLRVDYVTRERILLRVWEIVSSGVPTVKRATEQKCIVIRTVFALLVL